MLLIQRLILHFPGIIILQICNVIHDDIFKLKEDLMSVVENRIIVLSHLLLYLIYYCILLEIVPDITKLTQILFTFPLSGNTYIKTMNTTLSYSTCHLTWTIVVLFYWSKPQSVGTPERG
jgi:hypothetical protein